MGGARASIGAGDRPGSTPERGGTPVRRGGAPGRRRPRAPGGRPVPTAAPTSERAPSSSRRRRSTRGAGSHCRVRRALEAGGRPGAPLAHPDHLATVGGGHLPRSDRAEAHQPAQRPTGQRPVVHDQGADPQVGQRRPPRLAHPQRGPADVVVPQRVAGRHDHVDPGRRRRVDVDRSPTRTPAHHRHAAGVRPRADPPGRAPGSTPAPAPVPRPRAPTPPAPGPSGTGAGRGGRRPSRAGARRATRPGRAAGSRRDLQVRRPRVGHDARART